MWGEKEASVITLFAFENAPYLVTDLPLPPLRIQSVLRKYPAPYFSQIEAKRGKRKKPPPHPPGNKGKGIQEACAFCRGQRPYRGGVAKKGTWPLKKKLEK